MYIVAVALQDGFWHHVHSYSPERANRADTVAVVAEDFSTLEDQGAGPRTLPLPRDPDT